MLCTVHPVVGCAYVIVLHQQPARSLSNIEPVCLRCVRCVAVQSIVCCVAVVVPDATSTSPSCRLSLSVRPSSLTLIAYYNLPDLLFFLPACLSHPPSPPHVYVHARHTAAAPFHAISAASSLAYSPLPLSRPNSLSIANPRRSTQPVHAILACVPHFSPLLLEHRSLSAPPGLTLHTSAARLACRLVHINPRPPRRPALLPPSSAGTWKKP